MYRSEYTQADHEYYAKETHQEPDHKCDFCEAAFCDGQGGVKISDEKFCKSCIEAMNHYSYYRKLGISDKNIWLTTENEITDL